MNLLFWKMRVAKVTPKWATRSLLNIYRFLKFILTSNSSNSHDLKFLHDMRLSGVKVSNNQERHLLEKYYKLCADKSPKRAMRSKEFKVFSQHGEDGLILHILSIIGIFNHSFIEFGAGGKTSNTENLIINFGFSGLLIDGDQKELEKTKNRYASYGVEPDAIKTYCSWITRENINNLFEKNNFAGEVDILSIDIDGNDYWVWESIDSISPRLVVIEYNASLGKDKAISIQYNETHDKLDYHPLGWYHGASLKALEKLANKKSYSLVCCDSQGVNAFFVRDDLLKPPLVAIPSSEAYYEHQYRLSQASTDEQYSQIKDGSFVEV